MKTAPPAACRPRGDGRARKRPGLEGQRQRIVAAAVALFSEQGSASVTVSAICQRADVSRHTFYRCFADKDELLHHIYEGAVHSHIRRAIERLDGAEGLSLAATVDQVIDAILEQHALAQLVFAESGMPGSPARPIIDEAWGHAAAAMQRWYRRQLGAAPSRTLLKSVMAATQWLVQDAIAAGLDPAAVERSKASARQLFEGIYLSTRRAAAPS